MIDPNMESYIVVGDQTASVLNLIANSDLEIVVPIYPVG